MTTPTVTIERSDRGAVVALAGSLLVGGVDAVLEQLARRRRAGRGGRRPRGARRLRHRRGLGDPRAQAPARGRGGDLSHRGRLGRAANAARDRREQPADRAAARRRGAGIVAWVADVGEATAGAWRVAVELTGFLGAIVASVAGLVVRPWRLRFTSLVFHMQEAGLNAVPIVALMSFLIGVVLAFQGATQLRQFGAEVFVVDLIAISVLRELGILLTAIIVAGRSASAFTAVDRLDEDARGDRRDAHARPRPGRGAGGAAGAGADPDPAAPRRSSPTWRA